MIYQNELHETEHRGHLETLTPQTTHDSLRMIIRIVCSSFVPMGLNNELKKYIHKEGRE